MTVELIAYTQMPGKQGNPLAVVEQAALWLLAFGAATWAGLNVI